MFSIRKRLTCGDIHSLDEIDRLTFSVKILFCDKDRERIRQRPERLPGVQIFNIHHAGMKSGPVRVRAFVLPLDFHVILFPGSIRPIRVQADRTRSGQPLHILLRLAVGNDQIGFPDNNAQHQFSQRDVILEKTAHKIIIYRPKPAQVL